MPLGNSHNREPTLTGPVREPARELSQARADAERERQELRTVLDARAATLAEARDDLRARAERAERDLDQARIELARLRQESGSDDGEASAPWPRRRRGQAPASQAGTNDTGQA